MLVGAKRAVTPLGSPVTENAIADLNPFTAAVENVMGIESPRFTLALVALGVSLKLGAASTVSLSG